MQSHGDFQARPRQLIATVPADKVRMDHAKVLLHELCVMTKNLFSGSEQIEEDCPPKFEGEEDFFVSGHFYPHLPIKRFVPSIL